MSNLSLVDVTSMALDRITETQPRLTEEEHGFRNFIRAKADLRRLIDLGYPSEDAVRAVCFRFSIKDRASRQNLSDDGRKYVLRKLAIRDELRDLALRRQNGGV